MNANDDIDFFKVSVDLANSYAELRLECAQWKALANSYKTQMDSLKSSLDAESNQTDER